LPADTPDKHSEFCRQMPPLHQSRTSTHQLRYHAARARPKPPSAPWVWPPRNILQALLAQERLHRGLQPLDAARAVVPLAVHHDQVLQALRGARAALTHPQHVDAALRSWLVQSTDCAGEIAVPCERLAPS